MSSTLDLNATCTARPVVQLDVDASANYLTVQKLTVDITYDDLYDVELLAADARKFIDSFSVSEVAGVFTATLSNPADFKEVLKRRLPVATCTTHGSGHAESNVNKNLHDAIYDEVEYDLSVLTNAVPDILEEAVHGNNEDWDSAVDSLADALTPTEVEIIAQQIPEENYILYSDGSGANFEGSLPLAGDNTIIFVFHTVVSQITRVDTKTPGANPDSGVTGSTTANDGLAYGGSDQGATYSGGSREIAFRLKLKNTAGAGLKLDA